MQLDGEGGTMSGPAATSVRLCLVGDIYLGADPAIDLAPDVRRLLGSADLTVGNLEGPVTRATHPVGGKAVLRMSPQAIERIKAWGINAISLANNHVFDYGPEGFRQTREGLSAAGIPFFGAGDNLGEARRPYIASVKGVRIGLLSYSWSFIQTTCATASSAGCAPMDPDVMLEDVRALRPQVDAVVIMPHWGYCNYLFATPQQVAMAEHLARQGAHVVGSHSHVVQGYVVRAGRLIAYSLGDFAFCEYEDRGVLCVPTRENRRGCILIASLRDGSVESLEFHHTVQRDRRIDLDDTPARRQEQARRNRPLEADDYGRFWRSYVRRRALGRLAHWANVLNWRHIRKETFTGAWLILKNSFARRR
jgi:poly-gamma-glutamate capsule biosynthesis protein CapA/YwtB (metallophosphatase superfamily)